MKIVVEHARLVGRLHHLDPELVRDKNGRTMYKDGDCVVATDYYFDLHLHRDTNWWCFIRW